MTHNLRNYWYLPTNVVSSYIAPSHWLQHWSTTSLVNEKRLLSISITLQGWNSFSTDLSPVIDREKTVEISRMSRCPVIGILSFSVVSWNGAAAVETPGEHPSWIFPWSKYPGWQQWQWLYCIKYWGRSLWTVFLPIGHDTKTGL